MYIYIYYVCSIVDTMLEGCSIGAFAVGQKWDSSKAMTNTKIILLCVSVYIYIYIQILCIHRYI